MKLIKTFKNLNSGVKRAIIVAGFPLSILIGAIFGDFENDGPPWAIFIFILYWILVIAGLWIYDGFQKDRKP